jgi:hypothetical protein
MRFVTWPALLLTAALLVGCERPAAPVLVEGAERFSPPPAYQLWWEVTQECAGRRGLFSRVRWYYVPGARTLLVNGQRVEGYWTSAGNTIVLAEAALLKGPLVRHEMLHALQDGDGHPREFFLRRCGGVVVCDGACADEEPLPPPNPALTRAEPNGLEIGVEIWPEAPSLGLYGGYLTLTVTARNPRADSVIVTLPGTMFGEPGTSFEYVVEDQVGATGGSARAWDDGVVRFAPGEVKRHVFDFRLYNADGSGPAVILSPGTQRLYGAYGGHWSSQSRTVTVP